MCRHEIQGPRVRPDLFTGKRPTRDVLPTAWCAGELDEMEVLGPGPLTSACCRTMTALSRTRHVGTPSLAMPHHRFFSQIFLDTSSSRCRPDLTQASFPSLPHGDTTCILNACTLSPLSHTLCCSHETVRLHDPPTPLYGLTRGRIIRRCSPSLLASHRRSQLLVAPPHLLDVPPSEALRPTHYPAETETQTEAGGRHRARRTSSLPRLRAVSFYRPALLVTRSTH